MLEIRQVTKSFGKKLTAVHELSLNLSHGVVGLIGHNGAGKTTLMQMVATLTRPSSGSILFQGSDIVQEAAGNPAKTWFFTAGFWYLPQPECAGIHAVFCCTQRNT